MDNDKLSRWLSTLESIEARCLTLGIENMKTDNKNPKIVADLLPLVYSKLKEHFAEKIELNKEIFWGEIFKFLCVHFSLKKEKVRELIKAVAARYSDVALTSHGVKFKKCGGK